MSIREDSVNNYAGDLVELITIDATDLGGTVLYLTPSGLGVKWQGNDYIAIPINISGQSIELKNAPARPKLSIAADRSTMLINMINSYSDLVGAKVSYTTTFSKYLDNGTEPDPTQYTPYEYYKIIQKESFSRSGIVFVLANPMDIPGIMIPRRQILRDPDIEYSLFCPGVARQRY